jgi:hypothetical protein
MKKILAFIMVALLIFCMASCGKKDVDNADATKDTTPTINNPTIEIESGTLEVGKNADGEYEIVGYTHKNEALVDLKLPDKLDEVDIVGIASRAFTADSTIKTVTIPATYEYVGKQAFFQCSALTSVTFENAENWSVDGTAILKTELENKSTAASYLTGANVGKIWLRAN